MDGGVTVALEIGFTKYVSRLRGGIWFYVGFDEDSGYFSCRRYISATEKPLPFPGGEELSLITTGYGEALPGFDVAANGWLVVDIPSDGEGNADRYVSRDAGYTWELVEE